MLMPWPTEDRPSSAANIANQLGLAGLLQRRPDRRITVTEEARRWLDGAGDVYLITVLHRHVRFVGELLAELRPKGLTAEEIRQVANDKYLLEWSGVDQVRRRCAWLQAANLVEHRFDHVFLRTQLGAELLTELNIIDPADFGRSDFQLPVGSSAAPR